MSYLRLCAAILLSYMFSVSVPGQEYLESEAYVSDGTVRKELRLPVVRTVYGGTKIIPEFEGDWTNEMKGAFEYACKLWEEVMPTTFPIRVKAVMDNTTTIYKDKPVLSTVSTAILNHSQYDLPQPVPITGTSTVLQIKGTTFEEFADGLSYNMYADIMDEGMLKDIDIIIKFFNYGDKISSNCSFALTETSDDNLYDFVTLVMRDLAKGFGVYWAQRVNPNAGILEFNFDRSIPFEFHVMEAVGNHDDSHKAFQNATKGSLNIKEDNVVYAPVEWDSNRSLSSFIPNDKKISQLLSYDFGRGTVVRDISGVDTYDFFRGILNWKTDFTVGTSSNGHIEISTETENAISYKGNISLAQPSAVSYNLEEVSHKALVSPMAMLPDNVKAELSKFHPNYLEGKGIDNNGWIISLLKKDGTWDAVYIQNTDPHTPLNVSTSDFVLHDDIDNYARSCDGYLRCRVTCYFISDVFARKIRKSYYMLLDYLPQRVKMEKSNVMPCDDEESYYRDVKIGLKDLEGVTKIVVSQLDEGNELPYQYEVQDFKKGYFIATVDKDFTSTFTITAYNKNGTTVSYPYVLTPLSSSEKVCLDFKKEGNTIRVETSSRGHSGQKLISSYDIRPLNSAGIGADTYVGQFSINGNYIDITSLEKGYYVLTVNDIKGCRHKFKFAR